MKTLSADCLSQRGIVIKSFWSLPPGRSHIVYYNGIRINPGSCQEDGFKYRSTALRFATKFLALQDEYDFHAKEDARG